MIYLTSAFCKGSTIREYVERLAQLGCRNIELTGGTSYYAEYPDDLLELKELYSLNYLIHNYFPPPEKDFVLNFTSPDIEVRTKSLLFMENSISFCKKIGVPLYSFHAGYTRQLKPEKKGIYFSVDEAFTQDISRATGLFYDNMTKILGKAVEADCKLAVENLFPISEAENFSLMCTPPEIETFLDYFAGDSKTGLLLDLGHLNVSSCYLKFDKSVFLKRLINKYGDRIFEVHISENNGLKDEHGISPMDSWQIGFIKENYDLFKDIPLTLEWHSANVDYDIKKYDMILQYLEG